MLTTFNYKRHWKIWVKNIQAAGYSGAPTLCSFETLLTAEPKFFYQNHNDVKFFIIYMPNYEISITVIIMNQIEKLLTLRIRLSFEMPHSFGECVLFRLRSNGEPPTNLDRWNINNLLQNLSRIYLLNTYAFMHETQCNCSNYNCKTGNIQLNFWKSRPTKNLYNPTISKVQKIFHWFLFT